jgi:hypothetical protein
MLLAPQSRSREAMRPIVTKALQKTHDARDRRKTVATRRPPNDACCIRHYYVLPVKFANSVVLRLATDHVLSDFSSKRCNALFHDTPRGISKLKCWSNAGRHTSQATLKRFPRIR